MRRTLLLLLIVWCPALAAAQTHAPSPAPASAPATGCQLPPDLWQRRQAFEREFEASGGNSSSAYNGIHRIDAQYRDFIRNVVEAYEKKQSIRLAGCCPQTETDPEAGMFCAAIRYIASGRKDTAGFLAAVPSTPQAAAALVGLREAASRDSSSQLASDPSYAITDSLYRLMIAGNAEATARYFYLFRHSQEAWARDAADELEDYITEHTAALIRNWPVLRQYWNLSEGITWDVDADWWVSVLGRYRRACSASRPRCQEILDLIEGAAHAAGAPQSQLQPAPSETLHPAKHL